MQPVNRYRAPQQPLKTQTLPQRKAQRTFLLAGLMAVSGLMLISVLL